MVKDKIHCRAKGATQVLTRQPVEGRSRKGGFRVGEMERDSLISHGVSALLIDRLRDQSDRFVTVICDKCGSLGEHEAPEDHINHFQFPAYCRSCESPDHMHLVVLPYAFKLLSQELQAVHVDLVFELE